MKITKSFYFCSAHRLLGHEDKCANMHGHNYRVDVTLHLNPTIDLDAVGRAIDFSVIKKKVGHWLNTHWDHAFLVNYADSEIVDFLKKTGMKAFGFNGNATAENMAKYLYERTIPEVMSEYLGESLRLKSVKVWETDTSSAEVSEVTDGQ